MSDVRYAWRGIRNNPAFSAAVVLTLALGIGVNTAIFSFVDRLLLRGLPFPQSGRLASLFIYAPPYYNSMSYPDYLHFRDHNRTFSDLAAHTAVSTDFPEESESTQGEAVSANYFPALQVSLALGRTFTTEEDAVPGRNPVLILGYGLWQRRFGGDRGVLGRQIPIDGTAFIVIGVAPPGFAGLRLDRSAKPEFWVPTMMYPVFFSSGQDLQHYCCNQWLHVTGRLKPGATLEQAQVDAGRLAAQAGWAASWKDAEVSKWTAVVVPANVAQFSPGSRKGVATFLGMLMAVVGCVLLIACANVAGLMLARALKREREIRVRLALGAGRWQLFRQFLAESLLLSSIGGAAGLAVAWIAARYLTGFEQPFQTQLLLETGLDARVLAYGLLLSALTGVLFGAAPLRQAFRMDLARPSHCRFGARDVFVVVQAALSMVLLMGAGLFVRTLRNAQATDVTRDARNVMLVRLQARDQQFWPQLHDRVSALPGVAGAALVSQPPMGGRINARDILVRPAAKVISVNVNVVSPRYFDTIGLPLVRGRDFQSRDRAGAPLVAIVNELMARRFWPNDDPIGRQFEIQRPPRLVEVVGVVRDGRFRNYRDTPAACFYLPLAQHEQRLVSLEARTASDPLRLANAVRLEIRALDAGMAAPKVQTLEAYRDAGLGQERLTAALLSGLGALAIALAAIGLYGVLAFSVAQRTREIGVRMALGATRGAVLRPVAGRALALMAAGVCAGLAAALPLAKLVADLLFGVTPADPVTCAAAALVLIAAGLAAAYFPARRAARIDPMEALRHE